MQKNPFGRKVDLQIESRSASSGVSAATRSRNDACARLLARTRTRFIRGDYANKEPTVTSRRRGFTRRRTPGCSERTSHDREILNSELISVAAFA